MDRTVFGNKADTGAQNLLDGFADQFLPSEFDRPAGDRLGPQDGFGEFGLAVALHAGHCQDLTLVDVEGDRVQGGGACRVDHGQVFDLQHCFTWGGFSLVQVQFHGTAHHQVGKLGGG